MTKKWLVCALFVLLAGRAGALVSLYSLADVTGNGSAHQLITSGQARWVQVITNSSNSAGVRFGGSATSATNGLSVAAGGGQFFPAIPTDAAQPVPGNNYYDLSTFYYYAANGDKFSVIWAY